MFNAFLFSFLLIIGVCRRLWFPFCFSINIHRYVKKGFSLPQKCTILATILVASLNKIYGNSIKHSLLSWKCITGGQVGYHCKNVLEKTVWGSYFGKRSCDKRSGEKKIVRNGVVKEEWENEHWNSGYVGNNKCWVKGIEKTDYQ